MASTINATTSSGIVATADNTGSLALQTSGTTAVTINTTQYVGINNTSPASSLDVTGHSASNGYYNFKGYSAGRGYGSYTNSSGTIVGYIGNGGGGSMNTGAVTDFGISSAGNLLFSAGGSLNEQMRIDSSGNVLVGTTAQASTSRFTVKAADTGYGGIGVVKFGGSTYWTQNVDSLDGYTWAKNGSDFWYAGRSGSNNCVSASGSWVNSSDSRLKTNIKTISNALENVCNLRGVSFNRISNNSSEIGLIAQEVLEIYPDAVEKPSTDKDFYGLNYGALVAPLIEAIKEQQTIINDLKARIETLENK